jgi:hypothetical protein
VLLTEGAHRQTAALLLGDDLPPQLAALGNGLRTGMVGHGLHDPRLARGRRDGFTGWLRSWLHNTPWTLQGLRTHPGASPTSRSGRLERRVCLSHDPQ